MDLPPVRLRPFTESDLVLFDRFATDPELSEPFEWLGFSSSEPSRRRWKEDRLLGSNPHCLAVEAADGGALVGFVSWRQNDRPGPGVLEIGALILPEMRGRGVGTAAQRMLVDYLFSTTTAHRIWAGTEVGNVAEQRALERCGFRQEGRLRGGHWRDGHWRDSLIYGLLRDEMPPSSTPAND